MAGKILLIIIALAYILLMCFITYKVTVKLSMKLIDLCFDSPRFRSVSMITFMIIFFLVGLFQLHDFLTENNTGLAQFFPLSFIALGLAMFLFLRNQTRSR